jgi:hypothetical protein
MEMTDQDILKKAARLRAARRRRFVKRCEVCGMRFEGIAQRRYCSDRCRVAAARARRAQHQEAQSPDPLPSPRGEHESLVEYFDRIRAAVMKGGRFTEDSTELIRRMRQEGASDDSAKIGSSISERSTANG